jgi:hypothetical protein
MKTNLAVKSKVPLHLLENMPYLEINWISKQHPNAILTANS